MNWSLIWPPEAAAWFQHWGLFAIVAVVVSLLTLALLRPFWLWWTGQGEVLERLRRLDEAQRKALFELEMLNETLTIPVKRAAQKAKADSRPTDETLVVSESTKADFLKVLEASRARVKSEE